MGNHKHWRIHLWREEKYYFKVRSHMYVPGYVDSFLLEYFLQGPDYGSGSYPSRRSSASSWVDSSSFSSSLMCCATAPTAVGWPCVSVSTCAASSRPRTKRKWRRWSTGMSSLFRSCYHGYSKLGLCGSGEKRKEKTGGWRKITSSALSYCGDVLRYSHQNRIFRKSEVLFLPIYENPVSQLS